MSSNSGSVRLRKMDIKLNDVYRFDYNKKYLKELFEPYWCFDAQLIVKQNKNGELYLQDTYWGFNDNGGKVFTLKQILERGELTFICNLDEVEECEKNDLQYYDDNDLFDLSYQHGCYKFYVKRKGAKKSPEKMKKAIEIKIKSAEREILWQQSSIEQLKEKLNKLNEGNLDIWI